MLIVWHFLDYTFQKLNPRFKKQAAGYALLSLAMEKDMTNAEVKAPVPSDDRTVSHALGEMTWLMTQSPRFRDYKLSDLEWMIMPALLVGQFKIFYNDQQVPIAFATWASVSESVEEKIKQQAKTQDHVKLMPADWQSGEHLWLMEMVVPHADGENHLAEKLLMGIKASLFKDRPFRFARAAEWGRTVAKHMNEQVGHA